MKETILLVLVLSLGMIPEQAKADFTFGTPHNLGPIINSASSDYGACISADGLELYFASERAGGFGAGDIWVSSRQSINDPWGPPANLGATVNGPYSESYPSLSSDGLTLYFSDAYSGAPRPGGLGAGDIWMTTRPGRDASWGTPVNLGAPINSSDLDMSATISGDGLTLVFNSRDRAGGFGSWDLWMSTRTGLQDLWGPPVNLGSAVNSGNWEGECGLSWDGLALFYGSGRTGIVGAVDIWMSTRKTIADSWTVAVNLGPVVNSSSNDGTARLSPDMRMLYFCSDRPGGFGSYDLLESPVVSVVDFNGDGLVDSADICIVADHWGENYSLCDIGPTPFGDGIVDVQDLIAFSEHLFEEVIDPTLVAHWAMDETEGDIAHDSAGDNIGYVMGGPIWQPDAGQINGAIQLDGVDDVMVAGAPLNPAAGPFSVLAWVKGGAPGQAIISEPGGPDWLSLDPLTGYLMTELTNSGRGATILMSQATIADGGWHRIGFIWDGGIRTLLVDGVAVAQDTQSNLESPTSGFYIGTGKAMAPGTYFSGLIDDVRIYNRAVSP